jgi:hypothetical protein
MVRYDRCCLIGGGGFLVVDARAVLDAYRRVGATNDVDALVGLFADDVVWNGVAHGLPWRRQTPS